MFFFKPSLQIAPKIEITVCWSRFVLLIDLLLYLLSYHRSLLTSNRNYKWLWLFRVQLKWYLNNFVPHLNHFWHRLKWVTKCYQFSCHYLLLKAANVTKYKINLFRDYNINYWAYDDWLVDFHNVWKHVKDIFSGHMTTKWYIGCKGSFII